MSNKNFSPRIKFLLIFAVVLIITPLTLFILQFRSHPISNTTEEWAQFGDFLGGTLNPIFAFLTFSALLYTIHLQQKTIKVSTEELELTRQELTRSADAQTNSQLVMQQQLQTQNAQQFDSIFFAMLRELNTLSGELENTTLNNIYSHIFSGRKKSIEQVYTQLLQEKSIAQYYMLLYQLLKIIDTKITEQDAEKTKKMYSNIVRASISEKLMQLLLINVSYPEFEQYRKLIEKFAFFEHVSFKVERSKPYNLLLVNLVTELDKTAFGDSIYFKKFQKAYIYSLFIPQNHLLNQANFLEAIFTQLSDKKELQQILLQDSKNSPTTPAYICVRVLNNKELHICLDKETYEPIKFSIVTDGIGQDKGNCKLDILNNEIKLYQGNINSDNLLYVIHFQPDGNIDIQYHGQY